MLATERPNQLNETKIPMTHSSIDELIVSSPFWRWPTCLLLNWLCPILSMAYRWIPNLQTSKLQTSHWVSPRLGGHCLGAEQGQKAGWIYSTLPANIPRTSTCVDWLSCDKNTLSTLNRFNMILHIYQWLYLLEKGLRSAPHMYRLTVQLNKIGAPSCRPFSKHLFPWPQVLHPITLLL